MITEAAISGLILRFTSVLNPTVAATPGRREVSKAYGFGCMGAVLHNLRGSRFRTFWSAQGWGAQVAESGVECLWPIIVAFKS